MSKLLLFCPKCREKVTLSDTEARGQTKCKTCDGPLFFEEAVSDGPSPASSAALRVESLGPGKSLGDFEILQVVGKGGMGMVYEARNTTLNRTVALKVIRPEYAQGDPDNVRRLQREAEAAAQLIHPNIVTLFSVGDDDGLSYIEMEYVPGPTAGDLALERGTLDVGLALQIVRDAASGLGAAHRLKIVHRDVKPDNILIHPDGLAKMSDFGLAKSFGEGPLDPGDLRSDITLPGIAIGTPHFMSPEQCEAAPLDGRSDLYSLGCTLYLLLTGTRPYRGGTTMTVMRQHLFDPPPDVTIHAPEVPEEVAAIIFKLMAKDPSKRYQTAEELIEDLDRVPVRPEFPLDGSELTREFRKRPQRTPAGRPAGKPVPTGPAAGDAPSGTKRAAWDSEKKAGRDSFLVPVVTGITLSLMVAVTIVAIWLAARGRTGAENGKTVPAAGNTNVLTTVPGGAVEPILRDLPDQLSHRFRTTIYDLSLNEKSLVVAAAGDDSFLHLWDPRSDRVLTKLGHSSAVVGVRFSPDGAYLASVAGSTLRLWRADALEKEELKIERADEEFTGLAFGPRSETLVTGSTKGLKFWRVPSGVLRDTFETDSAVTTLSFGPDCESLVAGDASGTVYYWKDLSSVRAPRKMQFFKDQRILSAQLSEDLQWLAVSVPQGFVVNNILGGQTRSPVKDEGNDHPKLVIARDARFVAIGREDGTVLFVDTSMRPIAKRKRFHGTRDLPGTYWFREFRFSHSGEWLLSAANDGSIALHRTRALELDEP